jgi:hypothetical protein
MVQPAAGVGRSQSTAGISPRIASS